MISLFLNGEQKSIATDTLLSQAIVAWHYNEPHFAVAINQAFVPRSEYESTLLKHGDRVEVVSPMQGG